MTKPRVLVFCPTYETIRNQTAIYPEVLSKIQSLNFSGQMDIEISTENPYPPPNYDNVLYQYRKARRMVLEGDYDALMTIEHDILVPKDALQKLWDTGAPVAYGVYLFHGSKNCINVFRLVYERPDMSHAMFPVMLAEAIKKEVIEVNGCGNGCTLIRREVLEAIDFRANDENTTIPDIPFAADCKWQGFKQVAHFGVQCGHISDGRTIYLDLNYATESMSRIRVNKYFTTGDGKTWRTGEFYTVPDTLAEEFSRMGYVEIMPKPKQYRPWVHSQAEADVKKLTVSVRAIQHKADALVKALRENGHNTIPSEQMGDCLLTDHDMDEWGYREIIERFWRAGKPVFLYPHGAAPILSWDGMREPCEKVKANLVTSPGHAEVMRRYGYPTPTHIIGWYLCDILPFKPAEELRVLFGPIHPVKGGRWQYPEDIAANQRTFERLLEIPYIQLTVRYIGDLAKNGLREVPGVQFLRGSPDNNYAEIDQADIVVSNGTLAYMSIARGKPTVMLNQMTCARDLAFGQVVRAKNTDKYADYMRYPYDMDNGDNLKKILMEAGRREPKQWKKRFIGEQFNPVEFCALLERLIRE